MPQPILLVLVAIVAGCAAAPTPTPTPIQPSATAVMTASPAHPGTPSFTPAPLRTTEPTPTREPTTSPTANPAPTPPPPIEGIWVSSRINRDLITQALIRHGVDPADTANVAAAHAFVDYLIYELIVEEGEWKLLEVPDGLPWGTGWRGTYRKVDPDAVVIRSSPACEVSLGLEFSASELSFSVTKDTCGDRDTLDQVATYEAASFHRVTGLGAPAPVLQSPPPGHIGRPPNDSSSTRRLSARPLGTVDGAPLGYLEYLPPDHEHDRPKPLLIALHGSGQSGAGDRASLTQLYEFGIPPLIRDNRWPDSRPFVVLAPQHEQVFPAACIPPAEIDEFLDFALEHYRIDPTRVYLTGLSCGAVGAWNYLGDHGNEVVAAAVLMAGGGYGAIDKAGCGLGRVPIWAFHGENDDVVPMRFSAHPMARLQACADPPPVDARLTLYDDAAHDVWTRTYNLSAGYDIYDWLLSYTR